VSMLAQHMDGGLPAEELSRTMTQTMEQASAALPGLGDPTPIIIDAQPGGWRSLSEEMNLYAACGARRCSAIFRTAGRGPWTACRREVRLRAGDVLTLAGSHGRLSQRGRCSVLA
jgi:hypothetical protein